MDKIIIQEERRQKLRSLVDQLNESCKKILRMAFYEELTNQEIKERLGFKNDQVVRTKKSKCVRALSDLIKKNNLGPEL